MLKRTLLERLYYALFWRALYTGMATRNAVFWYLKSGVYSNKVKTDYEGKENYCESKIISKTDLRKVQDH